jgi:pyrroloquinoline quinone (PQQ) biosynthesis protein C
MLQSTKNLTNVSPIKAPEKNINNQKFSREELGKFEVLNSWKNLVVNHEVFTKMGNGTLPIEQYRTLLLNFFPIVENFPKFMALNLAKTKCDKVGHEEAKTWLINNIRVEKNHCKWYIDWAEGFGVTETELKNHILTPEARALLQHLWHVSEKSNISSAFAAVNVGIEWATGEWSCIAKNGTKKYIENGLAHGSERKVSTWLTIHADYDDTHPFEAMELVANCSQSNEEFNEALEVGRQTLEYYFLALQGCLKNTTKH